MVMRVGRRVRLVWLGGKRAALPWICPTSQTCAKQSVEFAVRQGFARSVPSASSQLLQDGVLRRCFRSHLQPRAAVSGTCHIHSVSWKSMSSKDADGTQRDDTEIKQKGQWRKWIEDKLAAKEKNDSIRSSAENHSLSAGTSIGSHPSLEVVGKSNVHGDSQCLNPEDNFELSVLGREVQANDTDDHNSEDGLLGDMEHMNRISSRSTGDLGSFANKDQERAAEGDDFLQELEKIERSVRSGAAEDWRILDDVRYGAVNNDSIELSTDLGDYNATKGMESDLDDDEAIFYRDGLGFVTNTGFLEIPGLGDLENQELDKPYQFRPDRLYYPGQTYAPEDFDISRPTEERDEPISRVKKVHSSGEVWERSDFRNVRFLSQFITDTSRLHPRRTV
ncbi:hypothetical protein O6H91_03G078400 [Diphasiastrum complanatum]|uniref:Uncharacterized protein n=1 Tax=Diphasiastrum complanatum TaxID=34168 RepID=A0ACC2E841_DIPCM|nr:hypothetical protein O6H91_03G078400 [Diphasiastrum complanatum]